MNEAAESTPDASGNPRGEAALEEVVRRAMRLFVPAAVPAEHRGAS